MKNLKIIANSVEQKNWCQPTATCRRFTTKASHPTKKIQKL